MKNFSTGRLGRLFNVVIPECCNRGSQPLKNTTRFPITTFGNDVRREYVGGFTLIELLVVVLIIGILSAIALPQYRVAVAKSRAAELFINVKAARTASDVYFYANGTRPTSWREMDIQIPYVSIEGSEGGTDNLIRTRNRNFYDLDKDGYVGGALPEANIRIESPYPEGGMWKGCTFVCRAIKTKKEYQQACLSLGGTPMGESWDWQAYCIK